MNCISEESPEYIKEAMKVEKCMIFDDIPKEERVLIFSVQRDDDVISTIYQKAVKARIYLAYLEQMHLNFNKL
jgi:hypothetical protein